ICDCLKNIYGKRVSVQGFSLHLFPIFRVLAPDRRYPVHIFRGRQAEQHGIQKLAGPDIESSGTAYYRDKSPRKRTFPYTLHYFFSRKLYPLKVFFEKGVIRLSNLFNQSLSIFRCVILNGRRDIRFHRFPIFHNISLHRQKINYPPETLPLPDRYIKRDSFRFKRLLNLPERPVEICRLLIQLVDEDQTRDFEFAGILPYLFSFSFYS